MAHDMAVSDVLLVTVRTLFYHHECARGPFKWFHWRHNTLYDESGKRKSMDNSTWTILLFSQLGHSTGAEPERGGKNEQEEGE